MSTVNKDISQRDTEKNSSVALFIGIPDLLKKNEEAIFDALSAFEKQCPYCGRDQYRVGIRDRIEVDHFLPVSRGGQDVPWNILPVCKNCNRKKKDRLPVEFLPEDVFNRCNQYLIGVRQRYEEIGVHQHGSFDYLKALVRSHREFIVKNKNYDFIKELLSIVDPGQLRTLIGSSGSQLEQLVISQMRLREGIFESGIAMAPWKNYINRLSKQLPQTTTIITPALLKKMFESSDWKYVGRVHSRAYPTKKALYCAPELAHFSASNLRRLGERSAS